MKFRKKPVVIEAIQFIDNFTEIKEFCGDNVVGRGDDCIVIQTLEGDMCANKMDWIIKGVNGEFYPCKPDIFEKTYEKYED